MPSSATSSPVLDFINSKLIGRYFDEITADMEDALGIASRQLSSASIKHCSTSSLATYKKDKACLDKSSRTFYDAYSRVREGKDTDLKKLQTAYEAAVRDLEILEIQNQLFGAVIDADLGVKLANFFGPLMVLSKHAARWKSIQNTLAELQKDLAKAQSLTAAEGLKTALGLGITGIGVMTGPVGIGTTIGVAISAHAVGIVIDQVLGEGGSVKPFDVGKDSALTAMDCASQLEKKGLKALGPLGAVAGFTLDAKDAGAAYLQQKKVQSRIKALDSEFKSALSDLKKNVASLKKLQDEAQRAYDAAVRDAGGFRAKTSKRMMGAKELKKYKPPKK
jgi:hypothetical protein